MPLAPEATDDEERLDLARSHPAEAREIAANARPAWFTLVAEGYERPGRSPSVWPAAAPVGAGGVQPWACRLITLSGCGARSNRCVSIRAARPKILRSSRRCRSISSQSSSDAV
ncbi:hypothetical protein BD293_4260 [Roseinatronobacter monicus]|uniref:Uncharacterized protein n=1 Tax=Roseinatronobacter monicus TaxID=393481 RepID=A0A543K4E5_9RHOB|nr:hypothetical protein BD293_4260 [Roseinatronobacter monicus]